MDDVLRKRLYSEKRVLLCWLVSAYSVKLRSLLYSMMEIFLVDFADFLLMFFLLIILLLLCE